VDFYLIFNGWGGWIRTNECQSQSLVPYRLATPQYFIQWQSQLKDNSIDGVIEGT
jgi:hypothetical protein